eukprot:CAMPEP_0170559678 /NCGR_PEP_ID=MMETSP0211-20121228/44416_1 /TAXON_ID=311385 /ORGANISM="Pseudokeronopsis sp., Strain OXSARD2" /LENGTH=46 /DNA_ID= /DNA_START= /DNA_END= /DNA_ORIENTATION=
MSGHVIQGFTKLDRVDGIILFDSHDGVVFLKGENTLNGVDVVVVEY